MANPDFQRMSKPHERVPPKDWLVRTVQLFAFNVSASEYTHSHGKHKHRQMSLRSGRDPNNGRASRYGLLSL